MFVVRTAGNLVPAYAPGGDGVAAQLSNLATHPAVARGLAAGTLHAEGWVFDIASGEVAVVGHSGSRTAA
ncbi:hypothetical protein NN3_38260 [Nocardia neocaledoniensis NBRC 108232]|nr:hypothetical protein NN3_38260 [Nocardia neocaledoniensis NBRC 108232]